MTAFWALVSLSFACLLLFAYPYLIYPQVLRLLPRRPVATGQYDGKLSLLCCVFNEEESIKSKIENFARLKAATPDLEILVYDDCSKDRSADILGEYPELLTLVRGKANSGKASGMKRLAAMAQGDILVFTDANVMLDDSALVNLRKYFADAEVGGVCGTLIYEGGGSSVTADVGNTYWRLDERLRSLESATGSVMGADGSIFSVRSALYPNFPDSVLDDMTVSMSVVFAGKRLINAADVLAFERSVAQHDEEVRRKIRIGARASHTHSYLRPQLHRMDALNHFKYVSRKMLRWFGGVFLFASIAFGLSAIGLLLPSAALALVVIGLTVLALNRIVRLGVIDKAIESFVLIYATLYGVLLGMAGRTFATWTPAKSR